MTLQEDEKKLKEALSNLYEHIKEHGGDEYYYKDTPANRFEEAGINALIQIIKDIKEENHLKIHEEWNNRKKVVYDSKELIKLLKEPLDNPRKALRLGWFKEIYSHLKKIFENPIMLTEKQKVRQIKRWKRIVTKDNWGQHIFRDSQLMRNMLKNWEFTYYLFDKCPKKEKEYFAWSVWHCSEYTDFEKADYKKLMVLLLNLYIKCPKEDISDFVDNLTGCAGEGLFNKVEDISFLISLSKRCPRKDLKDLFNKLGISAKNGLFKQVNFIFIKTLFDKCKNEKISDLSTALITCSKHELFKKVGDTELGNLLLEFTEKYTKNELYSLFNLGLHSCSEVGIFNNLKWKTNIRKLADTAVQNEDWNGFIKFMNYLSKDILDPITFYCKLTKSLTGRIRNLKHQTVTNNIESFIEDCLIPFKKFLKDPNVQKLVFELGKIAGEYNEEDFKYVAKTVKKMYEKKINLKNLILLNGWLEERHFSPRAFYCDFEEENISDLTFSYSIALLKFKKLFPNPDIINSLIKSNTPNTENGILDFRKLIYDKDMYINEKLNWKVYRAYSKARKKIDYKYKKISYNFTYKGFKGMPKYDIEKVSRDILKRYNNAIVHTCLEIVRVENLIHSLRKISKKEIAVIANLRLGRVYVRPLEILRKKLGLHKVKFIYSKIGSTIFHETTYDLVNPFDRKTIKYFITKRPHIIVVDASVNDRFPDALKGYMNFFNAINEIISGGKAEDMISSITKKGQKQTSKYEDVSKSRDNYKSYVELRSILNKIKESSNIRTTEYYYEPYLLAYSALQKISLIRKGGSVGGANREYVLNVNSSDLSKGKYHTNFASPAFFDKLKGKKCLLLLNAQFPFFKIYKLAGNPLISWLSGEAVTHFKDGYGNFDDVEDALGKNLRVDSTKKIIQLDNEELLKEIAKKYEKIRNNVSKRTKSPKAPKRGN